MAINDIVADESLLPVLQTSAETLAQCQALLTLINPDTLPNDGAKLRELSLAASKQQKLLFALLAQLRGQNRDAIFRVRDTKQSTAEARQEIDRLHLQLQNLYYEQKHLTGEIAACEAYDHKYLSLPLIPVEEFLELHPEHRESSEHDLMIARIEHEHAEREKLEQARQELLKRKQGLIAENKKRKNDLANLDQDLEKFIDVCHSACPSLPWISLLISFITSRPLSRFKRSSRRNIRHCMWRRPGFLTATSDRRYWSIYPRFCDFRVLGVDNDMTSWALLGPSSPLSPN
ncbi:unnamed protein product [Penicillium nalgiovense]|nr:unnamed protein product [Penicillium nalgiovense]